MRHTRHDDSMATTLGSNGKRRSSSPEDYDMLNSSPQLPKRYSGNGSVNDDISAKREAATLRLQAVWEDIIARYSQHGGGEEDSDGGDVIDLETGTILVDHGHLRGLARTTGAVWGVPPTSKRRETVFRGVSGLNEESEDDYEDEDEDDFDENNTSATKWGHVPVSSDQDETDGEETSWQLSQNVRTITSKLNTIPRDDRFNLPLDYDTLLLPPNPLAPILESAERVIALARVRAASKTDRDELHFLQQFRNGSGSKAMPNVTTKCLFFAAADRDEARLRTLFTT